LLKQKLAGRIIWAGQQPNVHQWLSACDACVVPSLKEPLGLCALEAMAASIPVAASAVGGLVEFVIPEQTGLLFNPQQPADISATVARILTDPPLRKRIVPSAKQMVAEQFSPDHLTDRIEAALQSVVSSPK
jgi:glycosyltransferase involved in cell wall biosynthesis